MVGTSEGHVESVSAEEATLVGNLGDETEGTQWPHLTWGWSSWKPKSERSRKPKSSLCGNARRSIGRSNSTETAGAHVLGPAM